MSVWFEGSSTIDCDIEQVKRALDNPGELHLGIVSLMPGLTSVELVDHGDTSVTIRTNEGLMRRTNLSKQVEADRVIVNFDEQYEAGSKVTTSAHFFEEFTPTDTEVVYRLVVSDLAASGLLGFFYRRFGSSKMGSAFLSACKAHFEMLNN